MAVPTFDKFVEPILRYLAQHPNGAPAKDVHEAAADQLGLSETDRQVLLPSGVQYMYKNRLGWAHDRLKRAGLSASLRRGYWCLTPAGFDYASKNPSPLPDGELDRLAFEYADVRLKNTGATVVSLENSSVSEESGIRQASPDDRLEGALAELKSTVVAELLETLGRVSPTFFEAIVLDLLHRMGYGASRADLQRVGGTGDGGIDGIISLDKLGLEKVYVQAKRWQQQVGRPEVQAFYGALAGQRANKGVFITTSGFTPHAQDFARSVEKIVLVNGARLAELMIEFEVGVTSRPIKVPKLDSDYFDEEAR